MGRYLTPDKRKLLFRQDPDGTTRDVTTQNPFPVSDGIVCSNEVWVAESDMGDFSGVPTDLFDNLHSVISDTTATNPKEIIIHFSTTVITSLIGIGAYATSGGTFSNIEILGALSDGVFVTLVDESADATVKQTETYNLPLNVGFNAIKLRFHTANTVTISNLIIPKTKITVSRIQAVNPGGTVVDIDATNGGNLKISLEELESGISVNSNSQLMTTQFDSAGNEIDTKPDSAGDYHLGASVIQNILTSSGNSTTVNLASAATFTGVAEETFGINGIQVYHFADQNCTIYLDQSLDSTNWDITDSFPCLANNACARTFTSVAPYFRIRVTNDGASATTAIRVAAGMTPIISPLPRALTEDDRLKTENTIVGQQNTERHTWVTPTNALSVESSTRLVGTNFDGQTKDPNFWTEATTGSGIVTQDGEIQLDTGTTANSTASYTSVRKARFVVGSALKFQGLYKFVTAGTTDNVRRMGAYLSTDGFFFQLDGTTFSIGTRKDSTDTLVNSGDFNGNFGPNFTPLTTQYYKFEIEWTPKGAFWYVDGVLLHKNGAGHLSDRLTLPISFENVNDNGSVVDVAFDCLGVAIVRLGDLITNSTYKYISGAVTTVCKYGAGTLHTIVNNDNSGSVIIYDNTAGSGTIIASIDLSKVLGTLTFDAPFSDGLTLVTTGAGAKITVVYE